MCQNNFLFTVVTAIVSFHPHVQYVGPLKSLLLCGVSQTMPALVKQLGKGCMLTLTLGNASDASLGSSCLHHRRVIMKFRATGFVRAKN
jgi:hypothetical protein